MKLLPTILTGVPTGPLIGVNEPIEGGLVIVKSSSLVYKTYAYDNLRFQKVAREGAGVTICGRVATVAAAAGQ